MRDMPWCAGIQPENSEPYPNAPVKRVAIKGKEMYSCELKNDRSIIKN